MRDPLTVIYENKFFILWHVDPESDGTDDSCGWFRPKLTKKEKAFADRLVTNKDDNLKDWFREEDEYRLIPQVSRIYQNFKGHLRPWWKHPKYHVFHWKIQIHFTQNLKRYLFSRCYKCGKRFAWGYWPVRDTSIRKGPRWFRGEPKSRHHNCDIPKGYNEAAS